MADPITKTELQNASLDAASLATAVNGNDTTNVTTRLGAVYPTVQKLFKTILDAANTILNSLGYAVPVTYTAGISLTTPNQTVSYNGDVYAPIQNQLPFTTSGTFETAKFRVIQGIVSSDLVSYLGATLVGYIQSGTGAITRLLQDKLSEIPSVKDFGAVGSGDETAKFQLAINATTNNTDVVIRVPKGAYTVTASSLTIGTRRIVWLLDTDATVSGDLIQSRADSTLLPGMTIWGGRVWRSPQTTSVVPMQVIKANAPLNFFGTKAALVVQQADDVALGAGGGEDAEVHAFSSAGDGAVNTGSGAVGWSTNSFYRGMRVQMDKSYGGTGHCITVNGNLGTEGVANPYNELGGVQGFLRNVGSNNGYLSGVEIRVSDSQDSAGLNSKSTTMIGLLGGIEKFNPSSVRATHAIYAQSSGTQDVDDAVKVDGKFRDGLNFKDAPVSRWSMLNRADGRIGWLRHSDNDNTIANCNRILQVVNELQLSFGANTSGYSFTIRDAVGNLLLRVDPFDNGRTRIEKLAIINATGLRLENFSTPASASATGTKGDVCADTNYIYVCTATNTWKRTAIATW